MTHNHKCKQELISLDNFDRIEDMKVNGEVYDVYIYQVPSHYIRSVMLPLIKGQYSLLDKQFVSNHIKRFLSETMVIETIPYAVIHKSPMLKKRLEEDLDVVIPDDVELDEAFHLSREIIGNPFNNINKNMICLSLKNYSVAHQNP